MTAIEPAIAVVNSNEDTVEMLRWVLHQHGFSNVVTGHVTAFRSGQVDFLQFVAQHDPKVFIWDIAIPYEPNWRFLQVLLAGDAMKGRKLVVTTTNKRRLEEIIGPTEALEIVGKPYDLDQIVKAVRAAVGVA